MRKIWITTFVWIIFFRCSPLATTEFLYSSESLLQPTNSFSQDAIGLKDHALQQLFDSVNCPNFEAQIWNHIYLTLFNNSPPPPPMSVKKKVKSYAKQYLSIKGANSRVMRDFSNHFTRLYSNVLAFFADKPKAIVLEQLAEIDLIDTTQNSAMENTMDPEVIQFVDSVTPMIAHIQDSIRHLHLPCATRSPSSVYSNHSDSVSNSPLLQIMRNDLHPVVYGARKIMATAYQSCHVLDLPLVRASQYSGVQGLVAVNQQGRGKVRKISSLPSLLSSHYYWKQSAQELKTNQCANVSHNPLVYDYGGKPFFSTFPYNTINLFKNAGSGSGVLGIDCSGFVLAALATSGLRVKAHHPIRGYHLSGISSWKLKSRSNGLSCLQSINISDSNPLLPGDILSVPGHVVIVDQISSDPLGLSKIHSVSQCSSQNISLSQINFSVIHSSANFNGIGIHRTHIRDVIHSQLRQGVIHLASSFCYKKFNRHVHISSPLSISRHTLSPECTEDEIYLVGETCLSSCSI